MRIRMAALAAVLCGVLLAGSAYSQGPSITVGNATTVAGGSAQIPVSVTAGVDLAGVNVRLVYDPAIFSNPTATAGPLISTGQALASNSPEAGKFNVVAYSPSGVGPFTARSGVAFTVGLTVSPGAAPGNYPITFADTIVGPPDTPGFGLSDTSGNSLNPAANNGQVTIAPLVFVSGAVMLDSSPVEGALVQADNGGGTTVTLANGTYSVPVPQGWTGTLTATKTGVTFDPIMITTPVNADLPDQNFAGTVPAETVTAPSTPAGQPTGLVSVPYTFSTGGSVDNLGNPVEYRFIWGDGTMSDYSTLTSADHTWTAAGTFQVSAQARSQTNPTIESPVSGDAQIVIGSAQTASLLYNISTRGEVGTGGSVMIAGFIIEGATSKTVGVTGWGPYLGTLGVPNVLADPTLTLYQGANALQTNDNWGDSPDKDEIIADTIAPNNALESAIIAHKLDPGPYTAILSGNNNTGLRNGLVAVWDVDTNNSILKNISTRGWVDTGGGVMIAGFIIQGTSPMTVAVTGWGPYLGTLGVPDALADPTLSIFSGETQLSTNDDYGTLPAADLQTLSNNQLTPNNPKESAVVITLVPGAYTAILSGVNSGTGNGIVAVWAIPTPAP